MIDSFYIYSKATDMVKQTGTRNPMKIASEIGVMLRYSEELDKLLGLYTYRWKHRIILLNDKMEEIMARMVCAHELGHDALHRDIAKGEGLKEFVLFNMKDTTEYEANAFAAHLIIDDDDIYSMSKEKYDVVQMAKMLNVNINLVLIKLQELNKLGDDFRVPCEADSLFFRKPKTLTSNELN
jgi:Zn-dependent peptidase ImmA (M78 family)